MAASFPIRFTLAQENTAPKTEDPLFAKSHRDIRVTNPKPRVITIPDVPISDGKAYKVLKGDFHMHTLYSDGTVMPRVRVQEAIENGLDCIAITDHIEYRPYLGGNSIKLAADNDNHNMAYNIAKPEAERNNLILIRGTEITKSTMPPGHFNAIFIKDANPIAEVVSDWKKMLAVAAEQGGFITWNHPGWVAPTSGGLAAGVPMAFTAEHEDVRKKGHLHGIEAFNETDYYPIVPDWCNELDLSVLACSDIHSPEYQLYGMQNPRRPMTLILAEDRTEEAIREAFFAHRTIGWAADMIFGRPEWVEKLFRANINAFATGGGWGRVRNMGDIPMNLKIRDTEYELKPQNEFSFRLDDYDVESDKCRVTNWFVGTNKPLEIPLKTMSSWIHVDW